MLRTKPVAFYQFFKDDWKEARLIFYLSSPGEPTDIYEEMDKTFCFKH
jgi:hypothetical protein